MPADLSALDPLCFNKSRGDVGGCLEWEWQGLAGREYIICLCVCVSVKKRGQMKEMEGQRMTREGDRTGWSCWWRWDVTVLPGIVWLIGIRSPLRCLDSNAMQSHMAIYIQWAPRAVNTLTLTHTYTPMLGKQNTYYSVWNAVIIFSSDTSPGCCRSSSGACWFPCCIQIQLFFPLVFLFHIFLVREKKICTWQELLLRKWLSVLKFLCYLLQTLSQSTNPPFRRGDKIATRWKAQVLRRHMALNNLWPSKIETATWSPE